MELDKETCKELVSILEGVLFLLTETGRYDSARLSTGSLINKLAILTDKLEGEKND